MTLAQIALAAGLAAAFAGFCAVRAVSFGSRSLSVVYRRLYGPTVAPAAVTTAWERPFARLGRSVASTTTGEQFAERRVYELRAAGVTADEIATRVITATFVGFVAAVAAAAMPIAVGVRIPWFAVGAPFVVALLTGWYQLQSIVASVGRRSRDFRAGIAAYIQLVSVCLTTRRAASEAVTYAADVGSGAAFRAISRAVHAAPQMGLSAWEALDAVGAEYGVRELEDLASSIANVAHIGVGVESTVVAVAARMRQVGLDEMQRRADQQTSTMFGPTMLFVLGTIAFLAYPLMQRVLDAFSSTS